MGRLATAVLGLAIAASGCAAPGPNTALGPADAISQPRASIATPTASGPRYLGPLASPTTYAGPGIRLVPPGPAVPRRPWTATLAVCGHNGDGCGDRGHRPTVTLARATSPQAGTARPDGSIDPLMDATLVYVLHWTGMMCLPVGPLHYPPTATGTPATPAPCDALSFVDANTGAELYGASYPPE